MRRIFTYLLLIVTLLQFNWAAAAAYCGHETGAAAKHFGHHEHKHSTSDQAKPAKESKATNLAHADCEMCHFGSSAPSFEVLIALSNPSSQTVLAEPMEHASHIPSLPDRPDRSRLA